MLLSDGLHRSVPATEQGQNEEETLSVCEEQTVSIHEEQEEQTLSLPRKGDHATQPIPPSRSRPLLKYRRPLSIMSLLLLVPLLVAIVHVSTLLTATDDQLLVR